MKAHRRFSESYRWEEVPVDAYKNEGEGFRDVSRQVLFGAEAGLPSELRYFEIAPGGHSTLERHEHTHAVMILRGAGRALVAEEIVELRPFDLVAVPPATWHQLRADDAEPLGFLCLVSAERDRPRRPDEAELAALKRHPAIGGFIR